MERYIEAKSLFHRLPDSFLLVNRYGMIEQCHVTDESLFSKNPSPDLLIWEVFEEDIHPILWTLMQKARLTRKGQLEEVSVDRSGSKRWFEVHIHPSGASFSILFKDVTEKNKSLEKLMEEERLSSIGTLAGGLAHQYNNIHHAVLGLLETSLRLSGQEQKVMIKNAIHQLQSGASLTKSLLDFSRGHRAKGVTSFRLDDVFEQVRVLTSEELLRLGCSLKFSKAKEVVRTNKVVLEQILVNLVINAAHACLISPKKEISVSFHAAENTCRVCIKDTGCGISEEDRKKIFMPFFSTKGEFAHEKSPHARVRGTGLGLALSQRLARQFGGDLILKKTSKLGTTFEVSLPKGELSQLLEAQQEATENVSDRTSHNKLNVMILDDLPENRVVLKFHLKEKADKIIEYDSGDVPLSAIKDFSPDVIFVDWLMPGMNGNRFLMRLKKSKRFDLLKKSFVLSGYNNSEEIEAWRPLIGGVIEKPVSREKLLSYLLGT